MLRISAREIDDLLDGDWVLNDPTTEGMAPLKDGRITGLFKTPGVVAGLHIAQAIFERSGAEFEPFVREGDWVEAGVPLFSVTGTAESLHATYKLAQCVMEYAGGIALRTHAMVKAARAVNAHVSVAGTRKHAPGAKLVSLAGLFAGGGILHRGGLSDSVLVFDQHRILAEDPAAAVKRLIQQNPEKRVALEVESREEALYWAQVGVDILQCERFTPAALKDLVDELAQKYPHIRVNVAGGVNADNAADYAQSGAHVLVTSWPYFGRPHDVKMRFEAQP